MSRQKAEYSLPTASRTGRGESIYLHEYIEKGVYAFQDGNTSLAEWYFNLVIRSSSVLDPVVKARVQDFLDVINLFARADREAATARDAAKQAASDVAILSALPRKTQHDVARVVGNTAKYHAVRVADIMKAARRTTIQVMSVATKDERRLLFAEMQVHVSDVMAARKSVEKAWAELRTERQREQQLSMVHTAKKHANQDLKLGIEAFRAKQYDSAIGHFAKIVRAPFSFGEDLKARSACFLKVTRLAREAVITVNKYDSVAAHVKRHVSTTYGFEDDEYNRSVTRLSVAVGSRIIDIQDAAKRTRKAAEFVVGRTGIVDDLLVDSVVDKFRQLSTATDKVVALCRELEEVQQHARDRAELRKQQAFVEIDELFESDFLSADDAFQTMHDNKYVTMEDYRLRKMRFVKLWAKRAIDVELDDDQATAIAAVHGNVQVVARAGSGKTRAAFLVRHCGVSPRALLLLAFNKKAAAEMKERLERWLRAKEVPHVMTFHALGYAIVQPQEELIYDDLSRKALYLSRELQKIIDDYCQQGNWLATIIEYLLSLFRGPFDRNLKPDEVSRIVQERRGLQLETIRGDYVKSNAERLIANALFEYDVDYKYEKSVTWNGSVYRPDFTIEQPRHVVIEYFGVRGSDSYDEMSNAKREFWAQKRGCRFLEYSPADIESEGVDRFVERLLDDLRRMGIETRRLSDAEIWQKVREKQRIDRYSETMTIFVNRCRARNLEAEDLDRLVMKHAPGTKAERLFLKMARAVYREYLRKLRRENKEDFSGLMWRAGEIVRSGRSTFTRDRGREFGDVAKLKFILIDEFQDYSALFHNLLEAIRSVNADVEVFAVGDDWQAINGFAGSELAYFAQFEAHIGGNVNKCELTTNFRSSTSVVEAGNRLMKGRGTPGRSAADVTGGVYVAKLEKYRIAPLERLCHDSRRYVSAVVRLIRRLMRGARYGTPVRNVVMLSRTGTEPERHTALERFFGGVRRLLTTEERDRITVSTVHKYKGREEDAVLILDGLVRRFPLIHPTWEVFRVFGDRVDKLEEEERRLFYVALTRAKHEVVILSETDFASPYLADIKALPLRWEDCPVCPDFVEVRISGGYDDMSLLKRMSYTWYRQGRYWHCAYPKASFSLDNVKATIRGRSIRRIEAYTGDSCEFEEEIEF